MGMERKRMEIKLRRGAAGAPADSPKSGRETEQRGGRPRA